MADIVLLVHGFATSARRTWQEPGWVDLISEAGRAVIAPDLLGHGDADKPHEPEAYADVEQLVADRLPQTVTVDGIGYSAGARLLLALAAQNQDRFERLVIGGLGGRLLERRQGNPLLDALEGGNDDDIVAQRFKTMASSDGNDPKALAAFAQRNQPRLDREHLAGITIPILIVIGDRDFAGPGEPLAEALPNAELVTLRGVDHFGLPKSFEFMDRAFNFLGIDPMGG